MKKVTIKALTPLGLKGLQQIKEECSKTIVKWSLKKLNTKIEFTDNEVSIINPAMQFIDDLSHEKSIAGLQQIKKAYLDIGAVENKDYTLNYG